MNGTQAESVRDFLLMKLEQENNITLKVIEAIPDDNFDYKPHDKVMTARELAHHIYAAGAFFTGVTKAAKFEMPTGGDKPEIPTEKQALLEACHALNRAVVDNVSGLGGDHLATLVEFGNYGTIPAVVFFDWHINHMIHHRGQLSMYLRAMGAKVPATYGDSLDEPMNM